MLLEARHEDGSPMSAQELRDELMTLLVAGHETTASELAWAFERLARTPAVLRRLTDEIDRDGDDAYLTATVQETLRRRPVLPNAAPRLVMEPVEVGGWTYPEGCALVANSYLIHHDPAIYPDPYAFRPERFLDQAPGTYTWIPFGGGRRRCLGASFAQLEMKLVLRAVLANSTVAPQLRGSSAPGAAASRSARRPVRSRCSAAASAGRWPRRSRSRSGLGFVARRPIGAEGPQIALGIAHHEVARPVVLVRRLHHDLGARRLRALEAGIGIVHHEIHGGAAGSLVEALITLARGAEHHELVAERELGVSHPTVLAGVDRAALEAEGLLQGSRSPHVRPCT